MSRTNIDFGIDLGTTNSAIAVLKGTITEIIKNNYNNEITPSAVYIDKRGQVQTGILAKGQLGRESAAGNAYVEFKRRMGTDHRYVFKSANVTMSPEQLSAEILKSLRGDVQQRLGEDIQAAVITVPTAFDLRQCKATRHAGELAGLFLCPLVQEPVAAAIAYGYQAEVLKENWLVFDFGGGTFDAALIKAEEGILAVINHGGDNFLGGSDIDWAIVERLVLPLLTKNYNFPNLRRGNPEAQTLLANIKAAVEEAKIKLSRSDTAYLDDRIIRDASGVEVDLGEIKLTREGILPLAEPIIMRAVEISRRVLKEKNLPSSAIEKVILVGGPTLAPYFREILQGHLGIPLDISVDPLTVVARGAAIFAGMQKQPDKPKQKQPVRLDKNPYAVDLKYNAIGPDEVFTVRGAVTGREGEDLTGFMIEFVNDQTHWRSPRVPLGENGRFRVDLTGERHCQNVFRLELEDATGGRQVCQPDSLSYTIGVPMSDPPLLNPIAVALANNEADVFFRKGIPLPAKATRTYKTMTAVKRGSQEDCLNVPIVEGENELADRNRLLGRLIVKGADVRRDVPAGSEIEVTIEMDASRIIRTKAFIPVLNEEFEAVIDYNYASLDPARLKEEYRQEMARLDALRDKAGDAGDRAAAAILNELDKSGSPRELEPLLEAAPGDPDAANSAEKRLLEVKVVLDKAENTLRWPALCAEAKAALDNLDAIIAKVAEGPQYQARAARLRAQVQECIAQNRPERLKRMVEAVGDLHREILLAQPGFWIGLYEQLETETGKMADQDAVERLLNQGRQCIDRGNVPGLRSVVVQLLNLLPKEAGQAIRTAYDSTVNK